MSAFDRKAIVAQETAELEQRLRRDLEARGIAAAVSGEVASRIAQRAVGLSDDAYAAFVDGVAAASVPQEDPNAEIGALEIQRLVQDFAVELKKLDEGLRLLSAYLLRIRGRATKEHPRVVH